MDGSDARERTPARHHSRWGVVVAALLALLLGASAAAVMVTATSFPAAGAADRELLGEAVEARSDARTTLAVTVTEAGSTAAMAVLAVAVAVLLWVWRRRADALLVLVVLGGAAALFRLLKLAIDRPRPPAVLRLVTVSNEALPSGHATMNAAVVGSLVVVAWAGRRTVARVALVVAAALWITTVGATRVYLGVHWGTDVLAGWLLGFAWLAACTAVWLAVVGPSARDRALARR